MYILDSSIFLTGISGFILLFCSIVLRVVILKPNVRFQGVKLSKVRHPLGVATKEEERAAELVVRHWVNLEFQNIGLQKINQPRVYCMKITELRGAKPIELPPTNFKWRGVGAEGNLDHMFPIDINYHAGLGYFDFSVNPESVYSAYLESFILDTKIENTDSVQLDAYLTYEIMVVVGNGNFLVPPYYVVLEFSWEPSEKSIQGEVPVDLKWKKVKEGSFWGFYKS
jgi:hypothetical protein